VQQITAATAVINPKLPYHTLQAADDALPPFKALPAVHAAQDPATTAHKQPSTLCQQTACIVNPNPNQLT
jgi:hypothetical protein